MLLLTACADPGPPPDSVSTICVAASTPITQIQGNGDRSPLVDSRQSVRGTVTRISEETGFYIEESGSNADPHSSKALFIADADLASGVLPGQQLIIDGVVAELGTRRDTLTALINISHHEVCSGNFPLPLTRAHLPLKPGAREALEGMRVYFDQTLTLTDVYNLARGDLTLSANGVLRVPTEVVSAGLEANKRKEENRNQSISATWPGAPTAMAVGSTTEYAAGLMGHNERGQQLWLERVPEMNFARLPAVPAVADETAIRVVTSNLLNLFNGDGAGGGFPTERGAETFSDFQAQLSRTQAVMTAIQPHLLAVQELENDGFGPHSAANTLLDLLNSTGHDDWVAVKPDAGGIGEDVITVGLFYRRGVLEAVGSPHVLDRAEFRHLSRQPLAQVFRDTSSGVTFLVAVNHLKSKGSCPDSGDNADQGDGQGCWNAARVAAVQAEAPWLQQLASDAGTENILALGDMNAWRNEDPVKQFRSLGFVDLVEATNGLPQTSFLYWGQAGTLDYMFASPPLALHAKDTAIWHINANWPANMELPLPWLRSSDHDPVIVDFVFSQSVTSD